MPVSIENTVIRFNDGTTQSTAAGSASGTVTSVATGNGLQGGTITTSGTLSIACPGFNTVGSYCNSATDPNVSVSAGSNYAAGTIKVTNIYFDPSTAAAFTGINNILSGTWKWMGGNSGTTSYTQTGIACRVS